MNAPSRSLLALCMLQACGGSADRNSLNAEATDGVSLNGAPVALRIDVLPSIVRDADAALSSEFRALPQTVLPDPAVLDSLDVGQIDLVRPRLQTGRVTAFKVNPSVADVPGSTVPVLGTVWLRKPGTVQAYAARTDNQGDFEVWVLPGDTYRLEVVPDDPLLPTHGQDLVVDATPEPVVLDLGAGVPVYGRVTSEKGGVVDAGVHVVDAYGLTSATARSDQFGTYQVRVTPGAWNVVSEGRAFGQDPTITVSDVEIGENGAALALTYPTPLEIELVEGIVTDFDGAPVAGTTVRFIAESLTDYGGLDASWTADAPVAENGTFLTKVVPGIYTIEFLPPTVEGGPDFTPVTRRSVRIESETVLEDVLLPGLSPIHGTIVDESGDRVGGTSITCAEVGYDGRFWQTFSDNQGRFTVNLPAVPMLCDLVPPSVRTDLATARLAADFASTDDVSFELVTGEEVRGTVVAQEGPEQYAVVEVRDITGRLLGFTSTSDEGLFSLRVDLRGVPSTTP